MAVPHILNIGGNWLPGIREYNVTLEDIDSEDSERDEEGVFHRKRLRSNVYHADVTHIVQQSDLEDIIDAVKTDDTVTVEALGKEGSFEAYVSKLTSQLVLYEGQGGAVESWWQVNYTLVEV